MTTKTYNVNGNRVVLTKDQIMQVMQAVKGGESAYQATFPIMDEAEKTKLLQLADAMAEKLTESSYKTYKAYRNKVVKKYADLVKYIGTYGDK